MNSNTANYRVMIIDDIPENLQVLSNILYEENIEISFATNGKQALENIPFINPDLILLDISMPDMDGYQVCTILKNDKNTADIPIIFLTARAQTEDKIKGFQVGAVDYVSKPFNALELVSRVYTHLELKHARDTIKNQNEKLLELNLTKDKFFSIVAHDLKSPFNTLIGFSTLILDRFDSLNDEKKKQYLVMINNAANQGYNLLENLLHWARSQTGKLEWNPENLDITEVIKNAISLYTSIAAEKNIEIDVEIPANTTVYADENMLSTIFRNLISNALKYSFAGGKISIKSEHLADFIKLSVVDNGTGISDEVIKNLFKIDKHITTKGTSGEVGTGLGLLICREFVEKHKGKIWASSQIGRGSEFSFTIPIQNK